MISQTGRKGCVSLGPCNFQVALVGTPGQLYTLYTWSRGNERVVPSVPDLFRVLRICCSPPRLVMARGRRYPDSSHLQGASSIDARCHI